MYPKYNIGNIEIAIYPLTIILGITVGIIYFYCFMKKHQIIISLYLLLVSPLAALVVFMRVVVLENQSIPFLVWFIQKNQFQQ